MPSANNSRNTRPRVAPRARRTAISFCRAAPRASSRFATFPHAMSWSSPTQSSSNSRKRRNSARSSDHRPTPSTSVTVRTWLVTGYAWARRAATVFTSACAARRDTCGFSRPKMRSHPLARFRKVSGDIRGIAMGSREIASHKSVCACGCVPRNSLAATPATVKLCPFK